MAYFDISVATLPADEMFAGGGSLDFAIVDGSVSGDYSGSLRVEYVATLQAIPSFLQGEPGVAAAHVALSTQAAEAEIFLGNVPENQGDTATISDGVIDTTSGNILLFRFTDANPPTMTGTSRIDGASLSLTLTTTTMPSVLLGDVNLDGIVNFLDIAPFIGILSGPGA